MAFDGVKRGPCHVFGLGQCSLDHLGRIGNYPPPDSKCEFTGMIEEGGGPVATALTAAARWGHSSAFSGIVGDDDFGERIVESLREEGIDVTGVKVREGASSQYAFIAAEEGTGRRNIFWRRPTGSPLRPEEVDYTLLGEARIFHTDGLFTEASLAAARKAKEKKVLVSVDAGSLREGMEDLAGLSDVFIASEVFADAFAGQGNALDACRRIAALGPSVAAVTLGSRGYVAIADGEVIEGSAYSVEAVDTTGCGDVFHGGYIHGLLEGWTTVECLDFAAWAAAMASLRLGGRAGIPDAGLYPGSGRGR